jgi:cytidylate kinase
VEGRDTTFRVLPDAELKIYLTAGEEVRARRRYKQLLNKGKRVDFKKVLSELKKRDKRDSGRAVDPLQVVKDAWVLDTTDLSIEQVVQKIVERVSEMRR